MDVEYDSKEIEKLSKMNSGGLINLRLDELFRNCHKAAVKGNYTIYNAWLDRVWCELVGDAKDVEEKELNKINLKLPQTEVSKKTGFKKTSKEEKVLNSKQYVTLLEKEKFLRQLMNKQGKGTAYREDFDDYMDG